MVTKLDKMILDLIVNANALEYEGKTGWKSCPKWAVYLIRLGVALGAQSRSRDPFFTIVSVPERSFSAVFLGMGIVMARALVPDHKAESKERMEELLALGEGTAVILRNKDRKLKGQFVRIADTSMGELICIKVEKGTDRYISVHDAYRIEISEKQKINLPKKQTGKYYKEQSRLLEGLIPRDAQNDFQLRTSLEVVFVGPKKRLLHEMESTQFGTTSVGWRTTRQEGYLVDLLKPKSFRLIGSAYRTRVVPSGNARIGVVLEGLDPSAYVFDGSLALVKWGGFCRHTNRIAILDRTEAQYEAGIEAVNALYVSERTKDQVDFELPGPPVGVTVSAFPVMGGAI